jgi:ribosomal protein S18 acetylase RimI-like enzyme
MSSIVEITKQNNNLLHDFISNNKLPNTFRYFNKRTVDVIQNHLITILLVDDELPIGYAHIDFDDDKYWFGICIIDKYQGKGYGGKMMEYIFNDEKVKRIDKIYLTVDKINTVAINLYKKNEFLIIDEKESYFVMMRSVKMK